jgi:hypothetical protein
LDDVAGRVYARCGFSSGAGGSHSVRTTCFMISGSRLGRTSFLNAQASSRYSWLQSFARASFEHVGEYPGMCATGEVRQVVVALRRGAVHIGKRTRVQPDGARFRGASL